MQAQAGSIPLHNTVTQLSLPTRAGCDIGVTPVPTLAHTSPTSPPPPPVLRQPPASEQPEADEILHTAVSLLPRRLLGTPRG